MKVFSYTKTPPLLQTLQLVDSLRNDVLLTPLAASKKLEFRWNATIDRIFSTYRLEGNIIEKKTLYELLSPAGKKHPTSLDMQLLKYKRSLDYLYFTWSVNSEPVRPESVYDLYHITFQGKAKIDTEELRQYLQYLQIKPEHPIIQSALAFIMFYDLEPFTSDNKIFAHLFSLIFLYKENYNFRNLISFESYFYQDIDNYKSIIRQSLQFANVTLWVNYFAKAIEHQLNLFISSQEKNAYSKDAQEAFRTLNERQKQVLSLLDKPGEKIGNKEVQRLFNVSQITASRDLAKLASLGLLFTVGKGRSTYYTKA